MKQDAIKASPPDDRCRGGAVVEARSSRLRQQLLERIHRRYQTTRQTIELGQLRLDFTRIADPDRVLDMVAAEADRRERLNGERVSGDVLHLPYWAELWDSAAGIGTWLAEGGLGTFHENGGKRVRVLDLGCGMGLTGTAVAALGASVMFADLEPPALLFARLNSLPYRDQVRIRRLNWQTDTLEERFDLIIGADILYERKQWEFLEPFWRGHLKARGQVILGEPGRQTGDLFQGWIQSRGWELAEHRQVVPTRKQPIRLFVLTR